MVKARDTIIDDEHYLIKDAVKKYDESTGIQGSFWRLVRDIKEVQAETSFEAGIKEVAECVNGFMVLYSPKMWQAKLKDWGMGNDTN